MQQKIMYGIHNHALRHPAQTNNHQQQEGHAKGRNAVAIRTGLHADVGQRSLDLEKTKDFNVWRMNMTGRRIATGLVTNLGRNAENLFALGIMEDSPAVSQGMAIR